MNIFSKAAIISAIAFSLAFCCRAQDTKSQKKGVSMAASIETLEVKSEVFKAGAMIPEKFTCEGEDISPHLSWGKVPDSTKELALICDDPDAPMGTWVHWVIFGIPPTTTNLPENFPKADTAMGAKQGKNSFGKIGYGGPCPPPGSTHRYFFKLYALNKTLDLKPRVGKADIVKAMEGHIIAQGELMGRFGR
jgi:Raf kinase inhibitor-like YbhB/YbcL family protein